VGQIWKPIDTLDLCRSSANHRYSYDGTEHPTKRADYLQLICFSNFVGATCPCGGKEKFELGPKGERRGYRLMSGTIHV
jgi:hypothetical protein